MKPAYITLTDGREVRVEFDMNALEQFTALSGKEITSFANNKFDIATLKTVALCAIREGEEIDGRVFDADEKGLGRLMGMNEIVKFSEILSKQTAPCEQKKSEPPNKLQRIFFR